MRRKNWPTSATTNSCTISSLSATNTVPTGFQTPSAFVDSPAYWRASTAIDGSPGRADPAPSRLEVGELKTGLDGLQARIVTASDVTYVLETSPDLRTWTPTATNTGPAISSLKFLPGTEGRFLRATRR